MSVYSHHVISSVCDMECYRLVWWVVGRETSDRRLWASWHIKGQMENLSKWIFFYLICLPQMSKFHHQALFPKSKFVKFFCLNSHDSCLVKNTVTHYAPRECKEFYSQMVLGDEGGPIIIALNLVSELVTEMPFFVSFLVYI